MMMAEIHQRSFSQASVLGIIQSTYSVFFISVILMIYIFELVKHVPNIYLVSIIYNISTGSVLHVSHVNHGKA